MFKSFQPAAVLTGALTLLCSKKCTKVTEDSQWIGNSIVSKNFKPGQNITDTEDLLAACCTFCSASYKSGARKYGVLVKRRGGSCDCYGSSAKFKDCKNGKECTKAPALAEFFWTALVPKP